MVWNISGYDVLIDDEDYERLKGFKYYIHARSVRDWSKYYFWRNITIGGIRTITRLHRDIMGCVYKDGTLVDHKDGNTLDNRKVNLRLSTHAENTQNQKLRKNSKSGVKGVSWTKSRHKWLAQIIANGKHVYLGYHTDIKDAEAAYAKASKELHGEFSRLK